MASSTGNFVLGKGEVHFSLYRPGTFIPAGFRYLSQTPEFGLNIQANMLDRFDADHGVKEKADSIPLQTDRKGTFACQDIDKETMAYFFLGKKQTIAQTSATASTETITDVIPGLSYQIGLSDAAPTGFHSLSNVAVKKSTTVAVLGTDYDLNAELGIITPLAGGLFALGDDMALTFDRGAASIDQVISGNDPIEGVLRFIADNPEGDNTDFYMPRVRLSPNGDFALKGETWQQIPFSVEILKLRNREAIYANGRPYTPGA